jgi:hypothetical protein
MFPRTFISPRKDAIPLWGPRAGLHAATGVLLVPYLRQARTAAADRTAVYAAALVAVLLIVAFDVPFYGLGALLPAQAAASLVIVARSTDFFS